MCKGGGGGDGENKRRVERCQRQIRGKRGETKVFFFSN